MSEEETGKIYLSREGSSAEATAAFELLADELIEKGGPRPTEYLLIALAGCYTACKNS